jgi:methyl-accepting chemotaxis protein
MRFGLIYKVGSLLSLILTIAFGASIWLSTTTGVKNLGNSGEKSLSALKNLSEESAKNLFLSLESAARESLERGEMEVFREMLAKLGKMEGVSEIGLTNPDGTIVYSSQEDLLNTQFPEDTFEKVLSQGTNLWNSIDADSMLLIRAHEMEADCIRCHTSAKIGDVSGALFVRYETSKINDIKQSLAADIMSAKRNSIVLGVFSGLLGLLAAFFAVYWLLKNSVRKPLEGVSIRLQEMSLGHSVKRLDLKTNDEISAMADTLDEFADSLHNEVITMLKKLADGDLNISVSPKDDEDILRTSLKTVGETLNSILAQIQNSANKIAQGSVLMSEASQAVSQAATEQAASLEEISSSMSELGSQTKSNAENAAQANNLTEEVTTSADNGNQHMQSMVVAMEEISQAGENISKVNKVIDEIAFQINLLALNAAVEAARAGKHGRGFAVVADEVRSLAARSAAAARETAALIEGATEKTQKGAEIAGITADALSEILSGLSEVKDVVAEIATASSEQAEGISQVNNGLIQLDQATQKNTANAEESASVAEELADEAKTLKQILFHFKMKGQESERNRKLQPALPEVNYKIGKTDIEEES